MSTVVFVSQKVPDKNLLSEYVYRYHPDSAMREQIINDIEKHLKNLIPENIIVDLMIQVTLKEYKKNNDPKNT